MTKKERFDLYQIITDRVLVKLDEGVVPWRKTWKGGSSGLPRNATTGRPYRGINILLLLMSGHESPFWLTFKQAKKLGGTVKRGEKSTQIVFWKPWVKEETDDAGKKTKKTIMILRYYRVFNLDQTEGVKLPKKIVEQVEATKIVPTDEPWALPEAQAIVDNYADGPSIREIHDDLAAYNPSRDRVTIPLRRQFDTIPAFYATLYHELGHSTGHATRLSRPGVTDPTRFGSDKYADEELVAEFAASFLCGVAGMAREDRIENAAAYVAGWRDRLKADKKLVVYAAQRAQRAADWILGVRPETDDEDAQTDAQDAQRLVSA